MRRLVRLLRWFPETWAAVDRQAAAERAAAERAVAEQAAEATTAGRPAAGIDTRVAQVLILAAVVLTFQWYWGDRPFFHDLFGARLARHPTLARYTDLITFTWWSAAKLFGFLLVPALHARLLGLSLHDCGMGLRPAARPPGIASPGRLIYVVLFGAVLPLVVLVSFTAAFQATYPLYRLAGRSWLDFLLWESQYLLTFLSVEFFFRGYLLFGLRRALGSHAIFVMIVPYCMIHCLKPAAESLGAIVAGVVLGTLALGSGSIWYGVLIHVSIALSMDLLSSLQQHALPRLVHP